MQVHISMGNHKIDGILFLLGKLVFYNVSFWFVEIKKNSFKILGSLVWDNIR